MTHARLVSSIKIDELVLILTCYQILYHIDLNVNYISVEVRFEMKHCFNVVHVL